MAEVKCKYETTCAECGITIRVGDNLYWFEDQKICEACAVVEGVCCPKCRGGKKSTFEICWECSHSN